MSEVPTRKTTGIRFQEWMEIDVGIYKLSFLDIVMDIYYIRVVGVFSKIS